MFKGGTSLSKGYQVIRRFSEDVDITYDIRAFVPDLAAAAGEEAVPHAARSSAGRIIRMRLINGLGVALTTAAGVYLWSRSPGLTAVIAISMVLSMVVAGFAGAIIPMGLTAARQDPAQSPILSRHWHDLVRLDDANITAAA